MKANEHTPGSVDAASTNYERAQEHGVESVVWNNLGFGWQLTCLCGWASACDSMMAEVGSEFDAHLTDLGIEV